MEPVILLVSSSSSISLLSCASIYFIIFILIIINYYTGQNEFNRNYSNEPELNCNAHTGCLLNGNTCSIVNPRFISCTTPRTGYYLNSDIPTECKTCPDGMYISNNCSNSTDTECSYCNSVNNTIYNAELSCVDENTSRISPTDCLTGFIYQPGTSTTSDQCVLSPQSEFSCISPPTELKRGYVVTENNLNSPLDVTVECAPGYHGIPKVNSCTSNNTPYELFGCFPDICKDEDMTIGDNGCQFLQVVKNNYEGVSGSFEEVFCNSSNFRNLENKTGIEVCHKTCYLHPDSKYNQNLCILKPNNSISVEITLQSPPDIVYFNASDLNIFKTNFVNDVANILGIDSTYIVISDVIFGSYDSSTISVEFYISPTIYGDILITDTQITRALSTTNVIAGTVVSSSSITEFPQLNQDCVGNWSECETNCYKTYTITQEQSGNGRECDYIDGEKMQCVDGEGLCGEMMCSEFRCLNNKELIPNADTIKGDTEDVCCRDIICSGYCTDENCTAPIDEGDAADNEDGGIIYNGYRITRENDLNLHSADGILDVEIECTQGGMANPIPCSTTGERYILTGCS